MTTRTRQSRLATRRAAADRAAARSSGTITPTTGLDFGTDAPTRPLRVAIYIRISTDEEHQPFSLEAQELRLRSYIDIQPGWQFVGPVYRDEKSGATLDRPHLKKALAAAQAGKFDILLVYRVDRLSRSLRGLVDILDQLDDAGVGFRSATEPVDTSTAVGRMLVQMLGVFAQFERETIIDRVINGMERKAARGEWPGGYRPYGYELDRTTGKLAPVAAEEPVPPMIFELYVNERIGARAIGVRLNERGLRTKAGKPWNSEAVLTVLRNRVYLGEVYFRGTWYRAENHHKALVDADLFEQAQQILIARGDDHAKRAYVNSDYTLAGHIFCNNCGKRYQGTSATGRLYRYRYYTCFTRHRYGSDACPAERLPADEVEQAVLDAAMQTYQRTDLIDEAIQAVAASVDSMRDTYEAELGTIDAELTGINAKIDNLLNAIENGLGQEDTIERITGHRQRTNQLHERRHELTDLITSSPTGPTRDQLAGIIAGIHGAIEQADPNAIKRLFESIVHEVRVTGRNSIRPYFRIPTNGTTPALRSGVRTLTGSVPPAGYSPKLLPIRTAADSR